MSFTDQKAFIVSEKDIMGFTKHKKRFNCSLCGRVFALGDSARWIYANFRGSPVNCGNFFVCDKCDGDTKDVLQCAKLNYEEAVKAAKRWSIYGPEWQEEMR